jgi:hypothetical protein
MADRLGIKNFFFGKLPKDLEISGNDPSRYRLNQLEVKKWFLKLISQQNKPPPT